MGRNILFITTDQQRYDALGCNGGTVARTPVVDGLAAAGIRYERAVNQNTVCMPARSTMLTGQYVRTHGVVANGIPLPVDAPSVAAHLAEAAGYRTALLGKAHFEPGFDPGFRFEENARARRGDTGPWRGFERSVQVMHAAAWGDRPLSHYGRWLREHHPEHLHSYADLLQGSPGGDTGAPETKANPIPRAWYHTDWVADLTVEWLDGLADGDDWFCWMSFPDPHHPWDPPASELDRVDWRDLDLPPGHPGSDDAVRAVLAGKPPHWLAYWEGTFANREGGPAAFVPGRLTHDQIREVNAKVHVMNELIDEACGRVLATVAGRGWLDDTDVIFTTDHGELQGDFGLLYKGPFHTDALMRLPLVWRPAPSAGAVPAVVTDPVGQVDLAPTFCAIAGVEPPDWMQGRPLPTSRRRSRSGACSLRVGQPVPRVRHAPAVGRPGRLAVHRLRAVDRRPSQRAGEGVRRGGARPAVVGRLRADRHRPRRGRHRHRRAVRPGRRPPPVAQPVGRPRLPGPARRPHRRPVRQPARRGPDPRRRGPGLTPGAPVDALRTPDDRFADLPGYPFAPHYVEVADGEGGRLRVHHLDEGAAGGPVVLLLHGEPSWSYLYRTMIPVLVGAGLRCVAPDLVGFGRSDKPARREDYTYARHVEWMREALFDHLDLRDVTLVGQDWGGLIGLRLVGEHPERFARVVAANTGLPTGDRPLTEAFLDWQRFSQESPHLPRRGDRGRRLRHRPAARRRRRLRRPVPRRRATPPAPASSRPWSPPRRTTPPPRPTPRRGRRWPRSTGRSSPRSPTATPSPGAATRSSSGRCPAPRAATT